MASSVSIAGSSPDHPAGPAPTSTGTISESFDVLEGTVTIFDGDRWVKAGSGDFLHVPPGGLHGFRNEDGPATMLLHFAPGRHARPTSRASPRTAAPQR